MLPSKSIMDYMAEISRLFPPNSDNQDIMQSSPTPNTSISLFSQSMARSSSSNDTSLDSTPDKYTPRYLPDVLYTQKNLREIDNARAEYFQTPRSYEEQKYKFEDRKYEGFKHDFDMPSHNMYETPQRTHYRPITGRKITESQLKNDNIWSDNVFHTFNEEKDKFNKDSFYELFPTDKKPEVNTLDLTINYSSLTENISTVTHRSPNMSMLPNMSRPNMSHMTPNMTSMSQMGNITPNMTNMSPMGNLSDMTSTSPLPVMSHNLNRSRIMSEMSPLQNAYPLTYSTPFKEPIVGLGTYSQDRRGNKMCMFCKKNGETSIVYLTHSVKEKIGNKNIVTCPILRSHVCIACGVSGDNAHTITYCPLLRDSNNGQPLPSTTVTLKNTRVKSNGRRRY